MVPYHFCDLSFVRSQSLCPAVNEEILKVNGFQWDDFPGANEQSV